MISILMPIYNGIEFIDQSVGSVKAQIFQDWELIIGINGHGENSDVYKIAKKYTNEKIKVIDLHHIVGKSKALNQMLTHCKYNWIAILDVDDIWFPHKLVSQTRIIEKAPQYDVIGTGCCYFGELTQIPKLPVGDLKSFNFLATNPIINSSCLVRKELCYWEPDNILEDYDLWLRLWRKNKKFLNSGEILVFHRIHKNSFFNGSKQTKDFRKELIEKYKKTTSHESINSEKNFQVFHFG